jgi:hypothetical protein
MDIQYIVLGYRLKNYYNIEVCCKVFVLRENEKLDRRHYRIRILVSNKK